MVASGSYNGFLENYHYSRKSEIFQDDKWTDIQDAPKTLAGYAVVFSDGYFYYFGGGGDLNGAGIIRLNAASWTWSDGYIGFMAQTARVNHAVITIGNTFMVLGGHGKKYNEACVMNNDEMTCEKKSSFLQYFYESPAVFLVNDTYGNC